MAFPTSVNSQITDAVTQTNVKVLGDSPALSMGNLFQATAQALSNAAHNATSAQQQAAVTAQAASTQGVVGLYTTDSSIAKADKHLTDLAQRKDYCALFINGLTLNDADQQLLKNLQHLQYLQLENTDIKPPQLKALQQAMADTTIHCL